MVADTSRNIADNSISQIYFDGQRIWLGGNSALMMSPDNGQTWISFTKDDVFTLGAGIAAIGQASNRILVSAASEEADNFGAGLYYTENGGANWTHLPIRPFTGIGNVAYDFASLDSVAYATCFYSGLLQSFNRGTTWKNVFISTALEDDFEEDSVFDALAGRYFSAVIDPYYDDTTIVWAGSAEGVQRLYYIGKHKKLASNGINDIAVSRDDWWYGGNRGITYFNDSSLIYRSWDMDNGFPGTYVSAIAVKGDTVIAGLYLTATSQADGFAITTNKGQNWTRKTTPQALGTNRRVNEIAIRGTRTWAACGSGGLIYSDDDGDTWTNLFFDDADTAQTNILNRIHCVDISQRGDTTRVAAGTDSGFVMYYFDANNELLDRRHFPLFDNTTYGQAVLSISTFVTETADEYWLAVRSYKDSFGQRPAALRSTDGGVLWEHFLTGPPAVDCYEIEVSRFFGDTLIWVATSAGMRYSTNFGTKFDAPVLQDLITREKISDGLPFRAVATGPFEMHFGAQDSGLAQLYVYQIAPGIFGQAFRVNQANLDSSQYDFVGRSFVAANATLTDTMLAGNFVPTLGLQLTQGKSIIWAAVDRTASNQKRGLCFTADRGESWSFTQENTQAWNFEFSGDTVFAAANQGLLMTTDFGQNWTKLDIVDPINERRISDSSQVYAVKKINGRLWVGTEDGVAYTNNLTSWTILRTFAPITTSQEEQTYVTPNPFSPYLGSTDLRFHYRLEKGGNVTITIYDFANNIVKKVVDGVARSANVQYDDLDTWNGLNSSGDPVAGGVYFYLLESSGGDKLWGKIMVIP